MNQKKLEFDDLLQAVDPQDIAFVEEMHRTFLAGGCKLELKEAKSGYVASYLLNKKTVANYVFRKKGMLIRIYAQHIPQYMEFLDALPPNMTGAIEKAPVCKRLVNPNDCNPKCQMGYDFLMGGQRRQKCRYSAFQFPITDENKPFLKDFIQRELAAWA